ncbi:MAG TPA: hypothetical protein VF037_10035 [Gemmatimonadales bacterium]
MKYGSLRRSGIPALLVLAGCQTETADITSLSVLLKEPPGQIEAAVVTVSAIELLGPNGTIPLLHQPRVVDLMDPAAAPFGIVNDYAVPALAYHELRVHVRGMYLAVRNPDGTVTRYATPAYPAVPAAEVDREIDLAHWRDAGGAVSLASGTLDLRGDQTILVLELDALESLGQPTGPGRVAFEPVIRGAELETMGGIRVTLEKPADSGIPLDAARAELFDERRNLVGVAHGFTDDDDDGVYEAMFGLLRPGEYRVVVSPPGGASSLAPLASKVSVPLGAAAEAHFSLASR